MSRVDNIQARCEDERIDCLLAKSAAGLTSEPTEEEQQELHAHRSIEVNEVRLDRVWNDEKRCAEYRAGAGEVWFCDHGPRIEVLSREDESIVAALQLAAEKFGGIVTISGPPGFRERAARLAACLGIVVLDQYLTGVVEHEKGLIGGVEIELGEDEQDLGR